MFWLVGLAVFVVLSLFNLVIFLLRLDNHQPRSQMIEVATTLGYSAQVNKVNSRPLLPPSIWSTRKLDDPIDISPLLSAAEKERATDLCGKFIFSTLRRAVRVGEMAKDVFVGEIFVTFSWVFKVDVSWTLPAE
jgi:hypothetical protein